MYKYLKKKTNLKTMLLKPERITFTIGSSFNKKRVT